MKESCLIFVGKGSAVDVRRVAAALDVDEEGRVGHDLALLVVEARQVHPAPVVAGADSVDAVALLDPTVAGVQHTNLSDIRPLQHLWNCCKTFFTLSLEFRYYLEASVYSGGASLPAAAPVALALALLDGDVVDLAHHRLTGELVHDGRDGRVQHERHQEQEGEDAHDAGLQRVYQASCQQNLWSKSTHSFSD